MAKVQVKVGTNTSRKVVIVDDTMTPKDIFAQNDISISTATVHLDGAILGPKDMNTTLADLNVSGEAMLIAVVKADNA